MPTLEDLASNELIRIEYTKTFLLNMFKKICVKMKRDIDFKKSIQVLYRQSCDNEETTKIIIKREFDYDLFGEELKLMNKWFQASLRKDDKRKQIPLSVKKDLYNKQNGICVSCGEALGNDWSKIHVDHIIPWVLVGDELEDNYQDLCDTCNECKSCKTDYIFKSMIKLI